MGYMGDVRFLESVQRRWTREIFGIRQLAQVERLKKLDLNTVCGRLARDDLISL